jgi:flagellar motor switch protein FliM
MDLRTESAVLELQPGQVIALEDAQGTVVRARCGTLWLTEEGQRQDFVLGAGERRVIASPGRTLIQAMKTSWVSIRPMQFA